MLYYETDRIEIHLPEGVRYIQGTRTPLLDDLLYARRRGDHNLMCSIEDTGAFTVVLEAVRTAPDPHPIPEHLVTWVGEGGDRRPVVTDVEFWCDKVALDAATFATVGAPWATTTEAGR